MCMCWGWPLICVDTHTCTYVWQREENLGYFYLMSTIYCDRHGLSLGPRHSIRLGYVVLMSVPLPAFFSLALHWKCSLAWMVYIYIYSMMGTLVPQMAQQILCHFFRFDSFPELSYCIKLTSQVGILNLRRMWRMGVRIPLRIEYE